jgi:RNA polymerase sigma-70 factor (ECF subfamily)
LISKRLEHDDFLRLLLKSEREIMRYIMAIVPQAGDAQDVFQDTAVALSKQIDKYDPSKPFTPWACGFAANKAKEHLKRAGRWNGFLNEDIASMLLARREELAPELDQRIVPLRDCLGELTKNNRRLIEKYYFDQASVEEVAEEVGRSVAATYKSLQRIRAGLMECINGKLASPEASL